MRVALYTLAFVLGSILIHPAIADPCEPQTLDPVRDLDLIREIGLPATLEPSDTRLNALVIGQDRRAGKAKHTDNLASRGDAIEVLSIDRRTGKTTVFSFYRGNLAPSSCWVDVTDSGGAPVVRGEQYLANLYRFGQRKKFVPCIERLMEGHLTAGDLKEFLDEGGFEIDTILETNFVSFRALAWSAFDAIAADPLHLGWMYLGHSTRLVGAANNRAAIRNALMPSGDLLTNLRERHAYDAQGYQRAFNHAKFLVTALGYAAFGENAETEHSHLSHFRLLFNQHVSASHPFAQLEQALTGPDGRSLLTHAGYESGASTVDIYQFGPRRGQYLLYSGGQKDHSHTRGHRLLNAIDTDLELVPAPKNVN